MSENSENLSRKEGEETPHRSKSIQRRKSLIFRRRSTLQAKSVTGMQDECNNQEPCSKMKENFGNIGSDNIQSENKAEFFDLQKYTNELKNERLLWIQTLHDRKRQRKNISKQAASMQRGEQDLDLHSLSENEKNFLLVRPNYEHICEKAKKLSTMRMETSIMNEHVTHLHKQCVSRAKKKLDDLTTRIIKLVD